MPTCSAAPFTGVRLWDGPEVGALKHLIGGRGRSLTTEVRSQHEGSRRAIDAASGTCSRSVPTSTKRPLSGTGYLTIGGVAGRNNQAHQEVPRGPAHMEGIEEVDFCGAEQSSSGRSAEATWSFAQPMYCRAWSRRENPEYGQDLMVMQPA